MQRTVGDVLYIKFILVFELMAKFVTVIFHIFQRLELKTMPTVYENQFKEVERICRKYGHNAPIQGEYVYDYMNKLVDVLHWMEDFIDNVDGSYAAMERLEE